MPKVTNPLQQNRLNAAASQLANEAGPLIYKYGRDSSITKANIRADIILLVKEGHIDKAQLPELARQLLSRGSDFNPFNNYGMNTGATLRTAAAHVATIAQNHFGLSLD